MDVYGSLWMAPRAGFEIGCSRNRCRPIAATTFRVFSRLPERSAPARELDAISYVIPLGLLGVDTLAARGLGAQPSSRAPTSTPEMAMSATVNWLDRIRLVLFALILIAGNASTQEDPRWPQWPGGPFYRTDFGGPEIFSDWAITSGVWEVRNGVLRQSATGARHMATVPNYSFGQFPDIGHNCFLVAPIVGPRAPSRVRAWCSILPIPATTTRRCSWRTVPCSSEHG